MATLIIMGPNITGMQYVSSAFTSLQGMIHVAFAMTKPDVKVAVLNFWTCRRGRGHDWTIRGATENGSTSLFMSRRLSVLWSRFLGVAETEEMREKILFKEQASAGGDSTASPGNISRQEPHADVMESEDAGGAGISLNDSSDNPEDVEDLMLSGFFAPPAVKESSSTRQLRRSSLPSLGQRRRSSLQSFGQRRHSFLFGTSSFVEQNNDSSAKRKRGSFCTISDLTDQQPRRRASTPSLPKSQLSDQEPACDNNDDLKTNQPSRTTSRRRMAVVAEHPSGKNHSSSSLAAPPEQQSSSNSNDDNHISQEANTNTPNRCSSSPPLSDMAHDHDQQQPAEEVLEEGRIQDTEDTEDSDGETEIVFYNVDATIAERGLFDSVIPGGIWDEEDEWPEDDSDAEE